MSDTMEKTTIAQTFGTGDLRLETLTDQDYIAVNMTPVSKLPTLCPKYDDTKVKALSLRQQIRTTDLSVLQIKAEIGSLALYATTQLPQGQKSRIPTDFGVNKETLSIWRRLANALPIAQEEYIETIAKPESWEHPEGYKDHQFSMTRMIDLATKITNAKSGTLGKYKIGAGSDGMVMLIDPATKSVSKVKLHDIATFANQSRMKPHWEERLGRNVGKYRMWIEIEGATVPYCTINGLGNTYKLSANGSETTKCGRVILANIGVSKADKDVVFTMDTPLPEGLVDFDVRQPKLVGIISIDPEARGGKVNVSALPSNNFVTSDHHIPPVALSGDFEGLHALPLDHGSIHDFQMGGHTFTGRVLVVRFEDLSRDMWLDELKYPASESELRQRIEFSFWKAAQERSGLAIVNQNDGFESLNDLSKLKTYFDLEPATTDNFVRHLTAAGSDMAKALTEGLAKKVDTETVWNIAKLRDVIESGKRVISPPPPEKVDAPMGGIGKIAPPPRSPMGKSPPSDVPEYTPPATPDKAATGDADKATTDTPATADKPADKADKDADKDADKPADKDADKDADKADKDGPGSIMSELPVDIDYVNATYEARQTSDSQIIDAMSDYLTVIIDDGPHIGRADVNSLRNMMLTAIEYARATSECLTMLVDHFEIAKSEIGRSAIPESENQAIEILKAWLPKLPSLKTIVESYGNGRAKKDDKAVEFAKRLSS